MTVKESETDRKYPEASRIIRKKNRKGNERI